MTGQIDSILYIYVALFIIAGIITIIIGAKGKIIPFMGLRIGYAYVSKRLWRKYNVLTGILSIIYALILLVIGHWVNNILLIIASPLPYLAVLIAIIFMAEREAEKESMKTPSRGEEIEFRKGFRTAIPCLIVSIISYISAISYAVMMYPELPARVASHFGPGGQPNGYMTKGSLITVTIIAILLIAGVTFFLVYLGLKKPEAFYKPYMKWDAIMKSVDIMYVLLAYVNIIVSLSLVDTVYYNLEGTHILPAGAYLYVFLIPMIIFLAAITYYVVKGYQKPRIY